MEILEECDPETFELLIQLAYSMNCTVRVIKYDPICPVCKKKLHCNGTESVTLNKNIRVKRQKYIHQNCEHSSCISSLNQIKDKWCSYMRSIRNNPSIQSMMGYFSYQTKSELIFDKYNVNIPRSTVYYHHKKTSSQILYQLDLEQLKLLKQYGITLSGVYCYDEQYVFVNKELYMRMTLIDQYSKVILYEYLVSYDDFNNQTIENFLKTAINVHPLKAIITDGRKSYKSIIEATGSIHHRCYFHVMQNLMTNLQKHINKITRQNKKLQTQIENLEQQIKQIKQKKIKYKGPIPHQDTKTRKQTEKIKKLENKIREHKKQIRKNKKELKQIDYDKGRIQKIFTAETHKQAQRRFNTIYNQRKELNKHIQRFLENIKPELEILLNHTIDEEIPRTNNTVENYYRTTLPRSQKRKYRTLTGLKIRIKEQQIRWTHRNVLKLTDNINLNTYT